MPKINVEILSPAWAELDEIAEYFLHAIDVTSARNITDKIISSLERLGYSTFKISKKSCLDGVEKEVLERNKMEMDYRIKKS